MASTCMRSPLPPAEAPAAGGEAGPPGGEGLHPRTLKAAGQEPLARRGGLWGAEGRIPQRWLPRPSGSTVAPGARGRPRPSEGGRIQGGRNQD